MPTRNVVLTGHQAELVDQRVAEDKARLKALRDAARAGTADFTAGRYTAFDDASSLGRHLDKLAALRHQRDLATLPGRAPVSTPLC